MISCSACPAGHSCSDPELPPVPCAVGEYSSALATSCDDCPDGQQCLDPGDAPENCDSGYWSALVRHARAEHSTVCHICAKNRILLHVDVLL